MSAMGLGLFLIGTLSLYACEGSLIFKAISNSSRRDSLSGLVGAQALRLRPGMVGPPSKRYTVLSAMGSYKNLF